MSIRKHAAFFLFFIVSAPAFTQVTTTEVSGWRNSQSDGTSANTNVSFSLRMSLAGDDTPRNTATTGDNVSINVVIRPEEADVGALADIIIVDFIPPTNLKMRNSDGIFVPWGGKLSTLEPYLEGVTLTAELEAEVFSGQLGLANDHRIFIGFIVDGDLYFTPQALRFSITEEVTGPTPREQAITLFESTISPNIVQARCIQCHVAGGQAAGQSIHQFVPITNTDHLAINYQEFDELHTATSTNYILAKVQGMQAHGGSLIFSASSQQYRDLQDFLDLLDQAKAQGDIVIYP